MVSVSSKWTTSMYFLHSITPSLLLMSEHFSVSSYTSIIILIQ